MNKIKQLANITKTNEWPFVFLFLFEIFLHISFFSFPYGDDVRAAEYLHELGLINGIRQTYLNVSTRIFINAILWIMAGLPWIIWYIADSAMIVLLVYSISKLFVKTNKRFYNWMIVALFLLYPFTHMMTAGWKATTINYLWPAATGLYACTLLIREKKIHWYNYLIFASAELFACNADQTVVIYSVAFTLLLVFAVIIRNKVLGKRLLFLLTFTFFDLWLIMFSPGRPRRYFGEMALWYPDYGMRTFIEKLQMGFAETFIRFIFTPNIFFLILTLLITVSVWKKYQNSSCRIIATAPLFVCLCVGFFSGFLNNIFPELHLFCSVPYSYVGRTVYGGLINIDNFRLITSYVPLFTLMLCMLLVAIGIFLSIDDTKISLLAVLIYFLGIGSGMILGFSPTIYASDLRTLFNTFICLIIIIMLVLRENDNILSTNFKRGILYSVMLAASLNIFVVAVYGARMIESW